MRKMAHSFMDLSQGRTKDAVRSPIPEVSGPAVQLTNRFLFQSYFDSTLLEKAILVAAPNEPIINNRVTPAKKETISGYTLGLHPSSECPIAVQFEVGGQPSSSAPIVIVPGEIVRPHGLPKDVQEGGFSGFTWGLPFGWLGGGLANLRVFASADGDESWGGRPEVIFHRQRMQITNGATLPTNSLFNWPTRFPWPLGFSEQSIGQRGQAVVAVEPTRIEVSLRLTSLAAPATMRVLLQATDGLNLDSAGAPVLTEARFIDHTWEMFAVGGGAGNLSTQFPVVEVKDGPWVRLGINNGVGGGVTLQSQLAALDLAFVDIVRYGRL